MKFTIPIVLFSAFLLVSSANSYVVSCDIPIQDMFNRGQTTYEIKTDIDLKGATVVVPDGSTLLFIGGSISNGMLSGAFYVKNIKRGSMRVKLKQGSLILSLFDAYNYSSDVNVSILSSCVSGIVLKEDIVIDSGIKLRTSLDGNNHSIFVSSKASSGITISDVNKGLTISRLFVKRSYSGDINKNYALICTNSSNITITDCSIEGRLYFVNKAFLINKFVDCSGITIRNCTLTCDLSSCPKGWQYGQDHISFYSVSNIEIDSCRIISTNVNRVIKTSQFYSSNNYQVVSHSTDSVSFHNNCVIAKSEYGKQMWDMYCGSTNIIIKNNTFNISGFTRFIENKAYQDKYSNGLLMTSNIQISDNFVETSGSDLFQFRASTNCDSFIINGNTFIMGGANKNLQTGFTRYCGGYLQGYKSLSLTNNCFKWVDEAIGLPFLMVNFSCSETIIRNNAFYDVYRINIASGTHPLYGTQPVSGKVFVYSGNSKHYSGQYVKSREELYLSDLKLDEIAIQLEDNHFNNSYEVIYGDNVSIGKSLYQSKSKHSKPFYRSSN